MIPLGLTTADLRALRVAVTQAHRVKIRTSIQLLDGTPVIDITDYVDDGQVSFDDTQDVSRSLKLTLHDPRRSLPFDTNDPADTALFLDRMIHVSYEVELASGHWQPVPVFTGPLSALERDDTVVFLEAQGKDALAMGACWAPMTLHKGMKKTDAIRRILSERAGETSFNFPNLTAALPKPLSLGRDSIPWKVAKSIAAGMGMQLFYDGAGVCRLRPYPKVSVFSFTAEQHVMTPLKITYGTTVVNAVYVLGGHPKGSKTHVYATAVAPASHPLSPQKLGRNGVPRYLLPDGAVVHADTIKTRAEAQTLADRKLHDGLLQAVTVAFDSLPVPWLEEGDLCHVATDAGSVTFRLDQFALPLTVGANAYMAVNYHRNISLKSTHRGRRFLSK